MPVEVIDYEIVEDKICQDHLKGYVESKFKVEGTFKINGKIGKFVYSMFYDRDNGGSTVEILNEEDFTEEEIEEVVEYIQLNADNLFRERY